MLPARIAPRAAAAFCARVGGCLWASSATAPSAVTRRAALAAGAHLGRRPSSAARHLSTAGGQPGSSRWGGSPWRWALAAGACGAGGYAVGGQLGEARAGGSVSPLAEKLRELGRRADAWWMDVVQQLSDKHAGLKLLALAAAVVPLIGIFGAAYKSASGTRLAMALYKMYCLLFRIEMGKEPNALSHVLTNIVVIIGLFTSAVLLGVVNDEVQRRSYDARSGRNPVYAEDHVLILGWNRNSPALLHNIAKAIDTTAPSVANLWARKPAVVVLADKDKAEMDATVQEVIKDRGLHLHVHTRSGSVFRSSHLQKVSASRASTVILLHPDGDDITSDDAESIKAAAAMCWKTLRRPSMDVSRDNPQRMIVQMPSSIAQPGNLMWHMWRQVASQPAAATAPDTLASQSGGGDGKQGQQLQIQVLAMPDDALVNRMIAQTAAQPGIVTCWQDISDTSACSSNWVCPLVPDELQHASYKTLRRSYAQSVVCGFIGASGKMVLNPSDNTVPGPGSRLIMLTRTGMITPDEDAPQLYRQSAAAAARRLRRGSAYKAAPVNILVANWPSSDQLELMASFTDFTPAGSTVTFIHRAPHNLLWEQLQRLQRRLKRRRSQCRFRFLQHDHPTSMEALLEAGIKDADTVVIGTGEGELTDTQADARVLAALLQVQQAVLMSSGLDEAPHVVAPIRMHGSSSMAISYLNELSSSLGRDLAITPEFLVFRAVTSAMLAQVVSEPYYAKILAELLYSAHGQEMYLRSPESLNIPLGVPISFAEVCEAARLTDQTAIGYIHQRNISAANSSDAGEPADAASPHQQQAGGTLLGRLSAAADVTLAVPAAAKIVVGPKDFIVVLAHDFVVPAAKAG